MSYTEYKTDGEKNSTTEKTDKNSARKSQCHTTYTLWTRNIYTL